MSKIQTYLVSYRNNSQCLQMLHRFETIEAAKNEGADQATKLQSDLRLCFSHGLKAGFPKTRLILQKPCPAIKVFLMQRKCVLSYLEIFQKFKSCLSYFLFKLCNQVLISILR